MPCISTCNGPEQAAGKSCGHKLLSGFGDPGTLQALTRAWQALYKETRPDVIIVDYAPAALLAAVNLDCPRFITGNGFVTPAPGYPLADWRPDRPSDKIVQQTETLVLANISRVLPHDARPPARLSDLFESNGCLLTSYPVLDSYNGLRRNARYFAANLIEPSGEALQREYEIVCYLKPRFRGLASLAEGLRKSGRSALMMVPGLDDGVAAGLRGASLDVMTGFSDLESLLRNASLFIGHGNLNSLNQCLRMAIPMLLLPLQMENLNLAILLRQAGLAVTGTGQESVTDWAQLIATTISDSSMREKLELHAAAHHITGTAAVGSRFRELLDAMH